MTILLDLRQGDPSQYAQLAEKCVLAAEARGNSTLRFTTGIYSCAATPRSMMLGAAPRAYRHR
jgi:hypothetical protein